MRLFSYITIAALAPLGALHDPTSTMKETATERLAVMKSEARLYRFMDTKEGVSDVRLYPEPLERWSDPAAEEDDAVLFLWTRGPGRPVTAAQFVVRGDTWIHEFQSLALEPFRVEWHGGPVWSPNRPGVEFQKLDDVPAPARGRSGRLRQMESLAESFRPTVESPSLRKSQNELRLLAKPGYRYSDDPSRTVDGTLWLFAHGRTPKVLLLLEAHRAEDARLQWRYALAGLTSYSASVTRGGKRIWEVARREAPTRDPTATYLYRLGVPRT